MCGLTRHFCFKDFIPRMTQSCLQLDQVTPSKGNTFPSRVSTLASGSMYDLVSAY